MKIIKLKDGFKVESHTKGKFYKVNLDGPSCTCPHFLFRMKAIGGECKHIKAVREKYGKVKTKQISLKDEKKFNKIIDFVRKQKEIDSLELIKKFGEDKVSTLIARGDLIEGHGKIRVLE